MTRRCYLREKQRRISLPCRPHARCGEVNDVLGRLVQLSAYVFAGFVLTSPGPALAQWQPRGIVATSGTLGDILAANARASGSDSLHFAQRHERWTYVNGSRSIAVSVAVRDDEFRTSLDLNGLTYTAGRTHGARWRGDGNGIVHGVQADLQDDAIDRAPQAVFRLDAATCTLVGETHMPMPAWVIATNPVGDKPAFLYIDKATSSIVREVMRDGRTVITTRFDRFESVDGALRSRHWGVDNGTSADALDVTVDSIEPGAVAATETEYPQRRIFTSDKPLVKSVELPATLSGGEFTIDVDIDGRRVPFVLDTGTASITIDPAIASRHGGATLEHGQLPHMTIGPLQLDRVSALTVPFGGEGILGLDFFFGHVIELDYRGERVRVLSDDDARSVFADPKTTVIAANVEQGLPLVHGAFGFAQSDRFAIDTGSPHVLLTRPFALRFATEIATNWTPAGRPRIETYLEGEIAVQPYRVFGFDFANAQARDLLVGVQVPTTRTDDLAIPFDGIIGTDILSHFDVFVDYDHGRIGMRRA